MDAIQTKTPGGGTPGVVGTVDLCQLHRPGIAKIKLTPSGGKLQELAAAKCIPVEALLAFGVRNGITQHGRPATVIDYGPGCRSRIRPGVTRDGTHWGSEHVDACGKPTPAGDGKSAAKLPIVPYGVWWLDERRQHEWRITKLIIGEGESDAWACWLHGVPYLGIPGASMFACLKLEHVAGMATILVHEEPGQPGKKFAIDVAAHLRKIGFTGEVKIFSLPDGIKDPADLNVADAEHFVERLTAALEAAQPAVVEAAKPTPPPKPKPPCDCGHDHRLLPHDVNRIDLFALLNRTLGECDRSRKWICPFHDDHNPSLTIYRRKIDGRQKFKCRSCDAEGDALDFVQRYFRLDFHAAKVHLGLAAPPKAKCPESPVGPEEALRATLDISISLPAWCPHARQIVIRKRNDHRDCKMVEIPCKLLACAWCREQWNKERVEHFGSIFAAQPELYRVDDVAEWGTVHKRLARAEASYLRIKTPDGDVIFTNRPVKGAEPIAQADATAQMEAAIRAVEKGTNHPVTQSADWALPEKESEYERYKTDGPAIGPDGETKVRKRTKQVCERKGIACHDEYWSKLDRRALSIRLPESWSDAQVADFWRQCYGHCVFLGVQPDGKMRWTYGDDPRVWADDPPGEPGRRRDQEFLDQGSFWT